jgi:hypothetical protein
MSVDSEKILWGLWEDWKKPITYVPWLPDSVLEVIVDLLPPFLEKHLHTPEYGEEQWYKQWNWTQLTWNLGISLEYIGSHIDLPWDWIRLLERKDMTWEFYQKHRYRIHKIVEEDGWCGIPSSFKEYLCQKKFVRPEFFPEEERDKDFWKGMSSNPNISEKLLEENIYREWIWNDLFQNSVISPDTVERCLCRLGRGAFLLSVNWLWISKNTSLTPEFIEKYISYLDAMMLSSNTAINIQIVLAHRNTEWSYLLLSRNPSISFEGILSTRNIPEVWEKWNWFEITRCQDNIIEKMRLYPELPWNMTFLDGNRSLTDEYIEEHLSELNPQSLSNFCNPWLVEKYPDLLWRWDYLSMNPRILSRF